jgi:hypothetical protein
MQDRDRPIAPSPHRPIAPSRAKAADSPRFSGALSLHANGARGPSVRGIGARKNVIGCRVRAWHALAARLHEWHRSTVAPGTLRCVQNMFVHKQLFARVAPLNSRTRDASVRTKHVRAQATFCARGTAQQSHPGRFGAFKTCSCTNAVHLRISASAKRADGHQRPVLSDAFWRGPRGEIRCHG